MRTTVFKITIASRRAPVAPDINQELQWMGEALGLFSERDREKSCFRIFIELLKASKGDRPLSSDELAYHLHLARGTVVHHLNKLMESRLVVPNMRGYMLRSENLVRVIEQMEDDAARAFEQLKAVAKGIDKKM